MVSNEQIIREAIRNPTPENAQQVFKEIIIPDPRLEPVLTPIAEQVYNGSSSSIVAEGALDSIFDLTEDIVENIGWALKPSDPPENNPFGEGDSCRKISEIITTELY